MIRRRSEVDFSRVYSDTDETRAYYFSSRYSPLVQVDLHSKLTDPDRTIVGFKVPLFFIIFRLIKYSFLGLFFWHPEISWWEMTRAELIIAVINYITLYYFFLNARGDFLLLASKEKIKSVQ
jgi:hypothetical protein